MIKGYICEHEILPEQKSDFSCRHSGYEEKRYLINYYHDKDNLGFMNLIKVISVIKAINITNEGISNQGMDNRNKVMYIDNRMDNFHNQPREYYQKIIQI